VKHNTVRKGGVNKTSSFTGRGEGGGGERAVNEPFREKGVISSGKEKECKKRFFSLTEVISGMTEGGTTHKRRKGVRVRERKRGVYCHRKGNSYTGGKRHMVHMFGKKKLAGEKKSPCPRGLLLELALPKPS